MMLNKPPKISARLSLVMPIVASVVLTGLIGCQHLSHDNEYAQHNDKAIPSDILLCTAQYDPVCATLEENGKMIKQTFSNSCTVGHYKKGKVLDVTKGACQ